MKNIILPIFIYLGVGTISAQVSKSTIIRNDTVFATDLSTGVTTATPMVTSSQLDSMPRIDGGGNLKGSPVTNWQTPVVSLPLSPQATLTTKIASGLLVNASSTDSVITFDATTKAYKKVVLSSLGALPAFTYGRVSATSNLASTTYVSTGVGTKIPFNTTTYSSGMTFSGTDGVIPSASGRYRISWFLNGASGEFTGDGVYHVVQNGASVGNVFVNQMEAAGVNQTSPFIDANLVAGQAVTLHYQPTANDAVIFERGSYFDVMQLSGHLPISGTMTDLAFAENLTTNNPSITFDGLTARFNSATVNVEMATTSGTASIDFFNENAFTGGQANAGGTRFNATTTFAGFGELGVLDAGGNYRTYILRVLETGKMYKMEFTYLSQPTRVSLRVNNYNAGINANLVMGNGMSINNSQLNSTWTQTGNTISNNNTGNVGIGTTTPLSTLHINGSLSQTLTTTAASAYTALATDRIIIMNLAGVQTLTLPAANTCAGRTYMVKNPTKFMKQLSPSYTSNDGTTGFTHILEGETVEFISTGTVWQKVGGYDDQVTKSIYMANGAWNAKTICIGGLEFIINGTTSGAGRVIQARTTDGTTKSLTQNCTRTIGGAGVTGENPSNSAIPTVYTSLHTATTDIAGNYYRTVLDITDRTNTAVGKDNWIVTVENDGSINLLIRVQYTKSR